MKLQVGRVVAVDANELLVGGGLCVGFIAHLAGLPAGRPVYLCL